MNEISETNPNPNPGDIVTNLSKLKLLNHETSLLNKGLTFVPTPNIKEITNDIDIALADFIKRMTTKFYFSNKKSKNKTLHRKTNWQPPIPKNEKLKLFFKRIKTDIFDYKKTLEKLSLTKNLTPKEEKQLKRLSQNKTIEIKKADKGGSIVLMDILTYKQKALDHLNDTKMYEKIENDPLKDLKTNIEAFLETIYYHYHIDKETFDFLFPPKHPRTNLFYILPKLHKPMIPGRPVVSSVNSVNEHISEFLTKCIQPLTQKLNSHINDTKDFLKTIVNKKVRDTTYLVSIDVKSLYTNIPTQEGIQACLYYINKYKKETPSFTPNNRILKTLFHFVLENNYFLLNKDLYKQKHGCAMGTKMAPPYADLFLGKLETEKILTKKFMKYINLYKRFLDDIFILWKGTLDELHRFIDHINNIHPTIKFTYTYSKEKIDFLDTTIYIDEFSNTFKSRLFRKEICKNSILHYASYHPLHTKENIIHTQALRCRYLTTDNKYLDQELKILKTNLSRRGYPTHLIKKNINKVKMLNQKTGLKRASSIGYYNNKNKKYLKKSSTYRLPFIVKYCEHHTRIQKILYKNWNIIIEDSTLNKIYKNRPYIVYKRHRNLKDILTKTKFTKL